MLFCIPSHFHKCGVKFQNSGTLVAKCQKFVPKIQDKWRFSLQYHHWNWLYVLSTIFLCGQSIQVLRALACSEIVAKSKNFSSKTQLLSTKRLRERNSQRFFQMVGPNYYQNRLGFTYWFLDLRLFASRNFWYKRHRYIFRHNPQKNPFCDPILFCFQFWKSSPIFHKCGNF